MSSLQQHRQQSPPPPPLPPHRRGPWSAHEDAHLLSLVQLHGPHNWVRIASLVTSRTPKQCRERYHQNLKPSLNHDPITPEEGVMIERLVAEMGKRWAEIARRLHGRSDNAVKNWWNGGMNRRRRMCLRQRPHDAQQQHHHNHHAQRPLTIDVSRKHRHSHNHNHNHRQHQSPLPSPAYSDGSRGQTPGLISDGSSAFSASPRMPPSPIANTLPPLLDVTAGAQQQQMRRTSLPILLVPGEPRIPEYDPATHSYTHRYASEMPSYCNSGQDYHYLRHKVPQTPPPFGIRSFSEQDSRMTLASILG